MLSPLTRRPFALVPALLLAAVLTACQSTPSEKSTSEPASTEPAKGTFTASRFPAVHEDWARVGYRLDWVGFPFPGAGSRPKLVEMIAQGDILALQESRSTLTVMEASNGQVRWSTQLTGPLTKWIGLASAPGDGGRMLAFSESEVFTLALGTGNLVGRERFERVINTRPIVHDNLLISGTSTGIVQAHAMGASVAAWAFRAQGPIVADSVQIGDIVGTVSQAGDVVFHGLNGGLVGRARVFAGLDNDPVTDGNLLFVSSRDQSVWAFDTAGRTIWRYRTSNPLSAQPTAHAGMVYADTGAQGLTGFEAATGSVKWQNKDLHGSVVGVRGGRLLLWDGKSLSTVDPARGDLMERAEMPNVANVVLDKFEDGNLYALSRGGVLGKFIPR